MFVVLLKERWICVCGEVIRAERLGSRLCYLFTWTGLWLLSFPERPFFNVRELSSALL